jgi:hypothetical protein
MKRSLFERPSRDKGSIAASVLVHVVVIVLIASITFRYPLASLFSPAVPTPAPIRYVTVAPAPRGEAGTGVRSQKPPKKAVNPAAIFAPSITPTSLPPIPPPTINPGALNGSPNGSGGASSGLTTGVEVGMPDARLPIRPNALHLPLSTAEKNDSAVKAIFMAYREAEIEAEEHRGRDPRDWTIEHNGQKYGVDSQYIYLGKFKVPSAILAALPLNPHGVDGQRLLDSQEAARIQSDINLHTQGMSEDEFRAAVKRIRERKDREKKEEQDAKAKDGGSKPPQPIVP